MPTLERPRLAPLVLFIVFVCAVAAGTAWILSHLATLLYMEAGPYHMGSRVPLRMAGWLGVGSGLVAGALWCRIMIPRSMDRFRSNRPPGGVGIGVLAGVVSATLLHIGLMYLAERIQIGALIVGLVFGIVVGAALGAVCGLICRATIRAAWPTPLVAAPRTVDPQPEADNPTAG